MADPVHKIHSLLWFTQQQKYTENMTKPHVIYQIHHISNLPTDLILRNKGKKSTSNFPSDLTYFGTKKASFMLIMLM